MAGASASHRSRSSRVPGRNLDPHGHDTVRGWCQRGMPLLAKVPRGRRRTLTFVAGLRRTEIVAPCVFDGAINGDLFTAWVEQSLVPSLKPRDVVVLDNPGSHKGSSSYLLSHRAVPDQASIGRSRVGRNVGSPTRPSPRSAGHVPTCLAARSDYAPSGSDEGCHTPLRTVGWIVGSLLADVERSRETSG